MENERLGIFGDEVQTWAKAKANEMRNERKRFELINWRVILSSMPY